MTRDPPAPAAPRAPINPSMAAKYTLYYWPLPGRGIFIRSLFAFTNTPYINAPASEIMSIKNAPAASQPVPLRAPPFLVDHTADGYAISQLPAVAQYVAAKHGLLPEDVSKQCLALKVLCDCNDVLGELWRSNGNLKDPTGEWVLWDQKSWDDWRDGEFVRWLQMFEAMATKHGCTRDAGYMLGTSKATLADLATWSLWATMKRCLPLLAKPLDEHAPIVMALCVRLEQEQGGALAALVTEDTNEWGCLYCGGLIEQSIRKAISEGVDGKVKVS